LLCLARNSRAANIPFKNLKGRSDPAGNLKVDKGKSEGSAVCRIDPAVAAIMAVEAKREAEARTFAMMFI
jgi:phage terminase large subunit-like protein